MYVVGTAGHVDHGKSTLVKTLTGIDPDRWEEEQRREMTIDLGFAWLTLPSGRSVSVVDVPGHERFIKNMLAGVGGIDAALLIIAADESVMPQTAEHLAILDLLGVERGIVVLTKSDLVDEEWLALVDDEIAERLRGTTLADAPRIAVSSRTGAGIPALLAALDELLAATPSRSEATGAPRLPIDRSFTIGGFGTVVTGTLADGPLQIGQEIEILPEGLRARVRGLQTHKQQEERALPGTRVAVNLAGIHHSQIGRGDVLALPGQLQPTDRIDLQLRVIPDAPRAITQNMALDLFVGAAETSCNVTLLEGDTIEPGESGWVQLRLAHPLAVVRGERCIVRQPSPSLTIGGGVVADAHPPRHRRFRDDVIAGLNMLARGTPADLVQQALSDGPPQELSALAKASNLPESLVREGASELIEQGVIVVLGTGDRRQGTGNKEQGIRDNIAADRVRPRDNVAADRVRPRNDVAADRVRPTHQTLHAQSSIVLQSKSAWEKLAAKIADALRGYHKRYPLRRGIPREELRQRVKLTGRAGDAAITQVISESIAEANETAVWLHGFAPTPNSEQRRAVDGFLAAARKTPYSPPAPDLDAELLAWLIDSGAIVRAGPDVVFLRATYDELLAWVRATVAEHGSVTVGQFRDRFGTSRKYGLAFLEHLDERKITRREGEGRVLY